MRRGCIWPLVVKAIGGLSLTPSDTGVMPQKIHPSSGIGDAREQLNSEGFEIVSQTRLHLVGLRRSLVSHYVRTHHKIVNRFSGVGCDQDCASAHSGLPLR